MVRQDRKICLVQPSCLMSYDNSKTVWPPLGILSIAAVLMEQGWRVSIIDGILEGFDRDSQVDENVFLMGLPPEDMAARILEHDPAVVGFSLLFVNQLESALATAKIIRREAPSVFLLWGGPVCTLRAEELARYSEVDGLILGEAEDRIVEYLERARRRNDSGNLPPGAGIRTNGGFRIDRAYTPVEDLDALPMPARDLVDMDAYMNRVKEFKVLPKKLPATTILTSRGCPNQCIFCSSPVLYRRKYRMCSPGRIIDEIDLLIQRYGVGELMLVDENFSANRKRTEEFLDLLIRRDYGLAWFPMAGTHVMTLTEKILDKMVESGLYKLKVSFESGSERVLREIIRKPMDLEYAVRMIEHARSLGIAVGGNFIIGFPWETRAEIMESFEFARKLDLDFTVWNLATPYPHTPLTERAKAEGLLPEDFEFSDLAPGRAYFELPDVTLKELEAWRHDFWRDLNFCSPEKEARYYSYALSNPDYRPPLKPAGLNEQRQ